MLTVGHPADRARVRAETQRLAEALGFDEVAAGELCICASELTQNAVEHGRGEGTVTLEADPVARCLALEQADPGPGIDAAQAADRGRAGRCDGEGLAAVGRLMDVVDISVAAGPGRRIRALRYLGSREGVWLPRIVLVHRPLPGQDVSGDRAWFSRREGRLRLAVIDGLGHGPEAHEAARRAAEALDQSEASPLDRGMLHAHGALAGTRGAAISLLQLDLAREELTAVAVGNVRVVLHRSQRERWSVSGTEAVVGHGRPGSRGQLPVRLERAPWPRGEVLTAFSDGLSSSSMVPQGTPASWRADLMAFALRLFATASIPRDDATLLVAG